MYRRKIYGLKNNSPKNDKGDLIRLYFLLNQIEYIWGKTISLINGLIAEVGVFNGHNLYSCVFFIKLLAPDKKMLLFDTFEGF